MTVLLWSLTHVLPFGFPVKLQCNLLTKKEERKNPNNQRAMSVRVLGYFLNSLKAYFSCLSLICLGGAPTGTLCGEPSAPLRRVQQPLLFPKNPEPELTTIHNSGAALVWNQRREVPAVHPFKTLFPKQSRSQVPDWKKTLCHRLTLILNSSVEKVIGGKDEFTTAAKRVLLSLWQRTTKHSIPESERWEPRIIRFTLSKISLSHKICYHSLCIFVTLFLSSCFYV